MSATYLNYAKSAVKAAEQNPGEGIPVDGADTLYVVFKDGTYSVCDNGQEDDTANRETAIQWTVENIRQANA